MTNNESALVIQTDSQYDWHICLVSGQITPNLLLSLEFPTKGILLITTKKMTKEGKTERNLSCFLAQKLVVNLLEIDDDINDFLIHKKAIKDYLEKYIKEGQKVLYNMAGGQKNHVLYLACVLKNVDIFYIDINTNSYFQPTIDDSSNPYRKFTKSITILDFVPPLVYSFFKNQLIVEYHQDNDKSAYEKSVVENISIETLKQVTKINGFVSDLNKNFANLNLIKEKVIILNKHAAKLMSFDDRISTRENHNKYVGGTWMEWHCFKLIDEINSVIEGAKLSFVMNFKYVARKGEDPQEIDILIYHKERVFLIECKTEKTFDFFRDKDGKFQRKNNKADSTFDKLARIQEDFDKSTKSMILSLYPIPQSVITKAKNKKITCLSFSDMNAKPVLNIKNQIQDWLFSKL